MVQRIFKLSLLLVTVITLVSCESKKYETVKSGSIKPIVEKFTYNNHSYIWFESGIGRSATSGVVHDPNCDCYYADSLYYDLWY